MVPCILVHVWLLMTSGLFYYLFPSFFPRSFPSLVPIELLKVKKKRERGGERGREGGGERERKRESGKERERESDYVFLLLLIDCIILKCYKANAIRI